MSAISRKLASAETNTPSVVARNTSTAISAELRRAARQSRVPVSVISGGGGFRARRIDKLIRRVIIAAFFLVFCLPSFVAGIYLFGISSDVFETEVRFVVRNGDNSSIDSLGVLSSLAQAGQNKDAYVVARYLESHAAIQDLETNIGLRYRFLREEIDFFSRLSQAATIEDFQKYWKSHVDVTVDQRSSSVAVSIFAYTARDSYEIAQAIVGLAEGVVNQITNRSRQEEIRSAERELISSKDRLERIGADFQMLRERLGVVDADAAVKASEEILVELRGALLEKKQKLALLNPVLEEKAPQLRLLKAEIASLENQISDFQKPNSETNSATMSFAEVKRKMDRAQVEQEVARSSYADAFIRYEAARAQLDLTQVYLDLFLKPVLPETPLYPRRFLLWAIVFGGSLALWGGLFGLVILVRDHWAR